MNDNTKEMYPNLQERSWAEINLNHLAHNYHYLRQLAPKSKFLGLCKSNGYGHGSELIAKNLEELGADMLAVATIREGVTLRESGIKLPILVLGDSPISLIPLLFQYKLTQTIHSMEQAQQLRIQGKKENQQLSVHIKVDTGMARLGFLSEEKDKILQLFQWNEFYVEGLYTHFAQSEAKDDNSLYYTKNQFNLFKSICSFIEDNNYKIPIRHCANSGATLFHPDTHLDMIRPGIALYGYSPDGKENTNLQPVLELYSRIASLRFMKKNTAIGYGSTHILEKDSYIAVLPLGYGDGFPRSFSNKLTIKIHNTPCPVVGRLCMDLTMIDVTAVKGFVKIGDIATIYKEQELLEEAAKLSGTISYELLCQLTERIPRIGKH